MYVYDIFGTFVLNYIVIIFFGMVTTCSEVFKICALRRNDITVILNSCERKVKKIFVTCCIFELFCVLTVKIQEGRR